MSDNPQNQYTIKQLKQRFKTFKDAKIAFNLKARGWSALVDKLNSPNHEQLKNQIAKLRKENEKLQQKNEELKKSISKTHEFDEVGFWLLDRNFDRSKFSDFEVPEEATKLESVAKNFYKQLAQRYHPDKGGTEMQMSNVNRLYDQMMVLVEMNEGLGK
ncbi:hypothetical protein [Spirulina sp. 06S082]|uniref:hypothetical protein n=1 Tax=Spirulina sp. 06S082 TaxID=3110248 RepID=UPI002B20EA7B|nr:hypothetical protein [Spirulina sp. 06S082]MEA5467503.1 hypothetical protein [Spirulina sp. 06S082]